MVYQVKLLDYAWKSIMIYIINYRLLYTKVWNIYYIMNQFTIVIEDILSLSVESLSFSIFFKESYSTEKWSLYEMIVPYSKECSTRKLYCSMMSKITMPNGKCLLSWILQQTIIFKKNSHQFKISVTNS